MTISVLTNHDFKPKPAKEAERVFSRKAALTADKFAGLTRANKARAFTIATVNKAKLIQRARDTVARAIENETPFAVVRRQLVALFDTQGLPAPALHRLRTVYQQNTLGAYARARTEMLNEPDIKAAFPFWQYLTVGNGKPGINGVRATHAALHGLVFRADDPFWKRHDPPWEWGCRCFKAALTPGQVKRMRVKVRDETYVRTKIRVPGRGGRGIAPNPDFGFDETQFDLSKLDAELRKAVEAMTA